MDASSCYRIRRDERAQTHSPALEAVSQGKQQGSWKMVGDTRRRGSPGRASQHTIKRRRPGPAPSQPGLCVRQGGMPGQDRRCRRDTVWPSAVGLEGRGDPEKCGVDG